MGVSNAMGGWNTTYAAVSNAMGCCTYCYRSMPLGCDGWAWLPKGFAGTTCNLISGWEGSRKDNTCPSGYTTIYLAQDAGLNDSYVGGAGPCGAVVSQRES